MGAVTACFQPAWAQRLPASEAPSRIEQRFERQAVPESTPPVEFPAHEQPLPPSQAGSLKLVLTKVTVEGATVYPPSTLAAFTRDMIGKQISLLDLYAVRDAITARYRNDGYVLSQAVIPAQRIKGGQVTIQIIEGYVNNVIFQGQVTDRFGLLKDYAEKIKASRPLEESVLERYVLLMDDLPGLKVNTVLKPTDKGAVGSDLTVVIDRKPIDASLALDNRGTRSVGPYQIDADVVANDLLGQFDQTEVRGIGTPHIDELRYIDVTHTEQLGLDGATGLVGIRSVWSDPGYIVRQFDVKSRTLTLHTGLSYPLIRSRSETVRLTAEASYMNARTNSLGQLLSDDRVRTLSIGASCDIADSWQGSNLLQVTAYHGLDILNATNAHSLSTSRAGANPDFTKVLASAQRRQPLWDKFSLLLATEGQYSPDIVDTSQEYGIGGKIYGRAFDASEIAGDSGAAGKVEFRFGRAHV